MTDDQQQLTILAIILALIFWKRETSVDVGLKQTCVYPDGATIQVALGDECPYDSDHGGASTLGQKECPGGWWVDFDQPCPPTT